MTAAMKFKDACSLGKKKKAMTKLDSVLNDRDITFQTKVCIVKATIFPVVMYGRLSYEELMLSNCGAAEDS